MQTTRLNYRSSAPTTDFYMGADIVAQSESGNYSVVRVSAAAINRGGTSSYSNYQGSHTAAIDGEGQARFSGIMASGVALNATRWDVKADIQVSHNSDGTRGAVTLRQTISGWFSNVQTASLSGFPRISRRPSAPGTPVITPILGTNDFQAAWSPSTDNGDSPISAYLLRRWNNAEGTGAYIDHSANNTSRVLSGLVPGNTYRFGVYARNASPDNNGYSVMSTARVITTLTYMWVKVSGVWRRAIPYVKVAGKWKRANVFTKSAGVWKRGA